MFNNINLGEYFLLLSLGFFQPLIGTVCLFKSTMISFEYSDMLIFAQKSTYVILYSSLRILTTYITVFYYRVQVNILIICNRIFTVYHGKKVSYSKLALQYYDEVNYFMKNNSSVFSIVFSRVFLLRTYNDLKWKK